MPEFLVAPGKLFRGNVMRYAVGLSVVCFILISQARDAQQLSPETTCFFDRSDSELEFIYIIRGDQLLVQQAVFPGHTEGRWHYHDKLPDDARALFAKWCGRAGDKGSSLQPGPRWYLRLTIPDQAKERWTVFNDDNDAASAFFSHLKRRYAKRESMVNELPNWLKNEKRLLHIINPENEEKPGEESEERGRSSFRKP